jgi:hypothetical protein
MNSMLKPVLAGSLVAGLAMLGPPGAVIAGDVLPDDIKSAIDDLIKTGVEYNNRCDIEDGMFELVGTYSDLTVEIVGFASAQLRAVWRIDRGSDCECPAQIGVAAAAMAPHLAINIKDLFDDDFEACEDVIAAALEQTLAELPPEAGPPRGVGGPGVPGPDPLEENECRDTSNCLGVEPPGSDSASSTGR